MFVFAPDFGISSISWALDQPTASNVSEYTGTRSVAVNPWHAKWTANVTLAVQQGDDVFRTTRSFLARCLGTTNVFRLYATCDPQNSNYGVTVTSTVVQGATQMSISGAATPLTDGQFVTVNGQLLCLIADQAGSTIMFEPPLRQQATAGTTVVTSRPYALVYMTQSNLGWDIASWRQFGATFNVSEAINEADGAAPEVVAALPIGAITLPTLLNNQLGLAPSWNGGAVQVQDPYDLIDFTRTDSYTDYYWSWSGSDANDGKSAAAPFKTINHAFAVMTGPAVLHLLDDYVGLGAYNGATVQFTGKLKILGKGGRTIWHSRREVENAATFAFAPSGTGGAYVSSAARCANIVNGAFFDANFRDSNGVPTPMPDAGSIAACQTTHGTTYWDSVNGRLYINMVDGRAPDPDNGLIYGESLVFSLFELDETANGTILLENLEFCYNNGAAQGAACGVRPDPVGSATACRYGRKNCLFYGSSGNGSGTWDFAVTVSVACVAKYNHLDGLNYHSFVTTGSHGAFMTFYELNCVGKNNGYTGWRNQGTDSTSANGTTSHDSIHSLRMNGDYENSNGGVVADVNGTLCVLLYCKSLNPTGTANPKTCYWHSGTGNGPASGMYLWGCYANDGGDPTVHLLDNTGNGEAAGQFYVQHWRGETTGAVVGTIHDWNGNVLANLAAAA